MSKAQTVKDAQSEAYQAIRDLGFGGKLTKNAIILATYAVYAASIFVVLGLVWMVYKGLGGV